MSNRSFVIQIDVPSIKSYVFGTDPLNEVRGASALLDRLNRYEMGRVLCEHLGAPAIEQIYASGGAAQFLAQTGDESSVEAACRTLVRCLRDQTGGEVRAAYGVAPLQSADSYREAVRLAHYRLRCQREFEGVRYGASTLPVARECSSASHLPAAHRVDRGAEGAALLSEASRRKGQEGQEARAGDLWSGWMEYLREAGPWPVEEGWSALRCKEITEIGERSSRRGYLGVVYADGNAMGRIVQALDRPGTCRHFSTIVDQSIRTACFSGLAEVTGSEVEQVRERADRDRGSSPAATRVLPADILLLGGDDLLVALPADRALDFALHVSSEFERLTREKIAALRDDAARRFFREWIGDRGFTISCGVAIARSTHPFYLLLDLAEQLQRNAKRSAGVGATDAAPDADAAARVDFHVVAGAASHAVERVREETYGVATTAPRTLRPLTVAQLRSLRAAVGELRHADFPRSKLHELEDAALIGEEREATRRIRDIFSRCRHGRAVHQRDERSHRRALWDAVHLLCPEGHSVDFPWYRKGERRMLGVADLVDGHDLFRRRR